MSFSIANFLFGLIPIVTFTIVCLYLVYIKLISFKLALSVICAATTILILSSLNTYGPRVELKPTSMPHTPEVHQIDSGAELIPKEDKIRFEP